MNKTILSFAMLIAAVPAAAQRMNDGDTHEKTVLRVVEYRPAPGQFVNVHPGYQDGDTYGQMLDKCTKVMATDDASIISLGGYGGYVTFMFDHSIANVPDQADIVILGNAHTGNSEPGIVMVSRDVNGNGQPDDPWYELKGAADDDGTARYGYTITYGRPLTETRDEQQSSISRFVTIEQYIPWTDSEGHSGYMHKNSYHTQCYFPQWVDDAELSFSGTLLPANATNTATPPAENWVLSEFAWGYADNKGRTDIEGNSFDFGHAVDADRKPVEIDFVDFIRVYNAENQDCGWIGETSTEVCYAYDAHLDESIAAIRSSLAGVATISRDAARPVGYYTIDGKPLAVPQQGLLLVRMADGTVTKRLVKRKQ